MRATNPAYRTPSGSRRDVSGNHRGTILSCLSAEASCLCPEHMRRVRFEMGPRHTRQHAEQAAPSAPPGVSWTSSPRPPLSLRVIADPRAFDRSRWRETDIKHFIMPGWRSAGWTDHRPHAPQDQRSTSPSWTVALRAPTAMHSYYIIPAMPQANAPPPPGRTVALGGAPRR